MGQNVFFKAFRFAFKGISDLLRTEINFQIECAMAVLVIIFGLIFQISRTEWLFQILAIGLVLGIEALNTALEKLTDAVHPQYHQKIKKAKDIAAAGVLLTALAAIFVGIVIYSPYIFQLI